jgi:SNF2-related domain/Helicase conserved C-terminal domain
MRAELADLDAAYLEDIADAECLEEALRYLRDDAVVQRVWVSAQHALCGVIRARHGGFHTPAVYFTPHTWRVSSAQCSCVARFGCAHAAALLISALSDPVPGMPGAPSAPAARHTRAAEAAGASQARAATWERDLDALLDAGDETATSPGGQTALAIELTLTGSGQDGTSPPRLMARLVQQGKKGWVYGNLSWSRLDSYDYHGGFRPGHIRLLRELVALHRTRVNQTYYYHSYGDDKLIELSGFDSARLWPLLDEAHEAGLRLLHAGRRDPVDPPRAAEFCLDIASHDAVTITPVIRLAGDDSPKVLVGFIGTRAHGVVYRENPHSPRFGLARLVRPVPASLQRLAAEGGRLEVPGDSAGQFRTRYYPRLRHAATIISADGSFDPPEIAEPTLVLQAAYGGEHDVEIGWAWAYRVGESEFRLPLTAGGEHDARQYRDPAAERAILDSLPHASTPGDGARMLRGLDTMRFTTEVLPLLRDQPGVALEITGEAPGYHEATARIAVSADERPGDRDWFDLGVTITVEDRQVPFTDVFKALSRGDTHLLLPDGAYFSLDKPELRALKKLIEEARALRDQSADGSLAISRFQASLWDELAALGVVGRQAAAWQQQVHGLLHAEGIGQTDPPATVRAELRPYQLDGFRWLAFLWRHRLGGILADDMGLGKTLQTLTLISHAKAAGGGAADGPFLIVAPTSVVPNWAAEAARFAPDLVVRTITSRSQRITDLARDADAVVTSYTLLRLDFEDYTDQEWSGMFLDEAQAVKNHQSQIYQCARKLPAPVKVAITGTPMENNLMELWSLLSITAPGLFPSPSRFKEYYVQPIERKGDSSLLAQLKRRIRPLILRRTKQQVASDLPDKQEQVLEVELDPRHRRIYQTHLQRERQKILGLIGDIDANRFTILRSLTLLRQLSLHPALVDTAHGDVPSAKIDTLIEQLRDVAAGGHRALVFSQFTSFLTHVRIRLAAAGLKYCYLDGTTRNRGHILNTFKNGSEPVFLISLKAGGFGLNLTEADYCFLLDPWWNPATEAQAVDRTHRIGQTRNVMVYRLIAKDTIEEKVMALQARKAELFASVMDEGNAFGSRLTAEDIHGLFA